MGVVWCPKCLKMYNTDTGHDCRGITQVENAWEKLENWLKRYKVYNPKE